jgi:hypothetical protein
VGAYETPGEPGEEQRDADLDRSEQERVVARARVARRRDVPADIEAVGEAAADELCDERQQPEG